MTHDLLFGLVTGISFGFFLGVLAYLIHDANH